MENFFGGFFEKVAKCARWRGKGRPGALFLRGRRRFGVSLYDFGKFWVMDFVKGFARSVYFGFCGLLWYSERNTRNVRC